MVLLHNIKFCVVICLCRSQGSPVSIVARQQAGQLGLDSHHYHNQTGCGAHSRSYVMETRAPGLSSQGMKLTTHCHLVPRLKMHGAIPPHPIQLNGMVPD
jgi:hypothetical protein